MLEGGSSAGPVLLPPRSAPVSSRPAAAPSSSRPASSSRPDPPPSPPGQPLPRPPPGRPPPPAQIRPRLLPASRCPVLLPAGLLLPPRSSHILGYELYGYMHRSPIPAHTCESTGCFTNLNKSNTDHGKPLIISHNGASGDYPGCTDLAYQKAVDDGADVIDCPVQVTKDGIPICMSSINLMDDTTVARSQFASQTAVMKDIQSVLGVFTFNLTWDDTVKNLRPKISTPFSTFNLDRNPRYRNTGNFMRLSDFLDFTKDKDLLGIMISVEHGAFMAEELGFDMVDAVYQSP